MLKYKHVTIILVTILFVIILYPAPVNSQNILAFDDAIRIGLANNFDIKIARNNAEIASNNNVKGTANFLPKLDASGNYIFSASEQETNSPFSFGDSDTESMAGKVSLNWTIFDGFRMFMDKGRYSELKKTGEYQSKYNIENVVVGIARSYYDLVRQEQLLDVALDSRNISESRYNRETIKNEIGGSSTTDFLNAQVAFNNDKARFINQELNVELARHQLNIILGRDPGVEITVEKEINIIPLGTEIETIKTMARERNSGLLMTKHSKIAAEKNIGISRSNFFPKLSLNADYGYSDRTVASSSPQFTDDINTKSTDASVGLYLTFNIFNGFRNRADLKNAVLEAKNRALLLEDTENRLTGKSYELVSTFEKRLEIVQLEEQNVKAAEKNLNRQQNRYQLGSVSSLEFRDAQLSLFQAQTSLITARYQARITRLEIEQLIGNLLLN